MAGKTAKPQIRFTGFDDTWEQRKFNEVFDFLQNNALSRAELVTEGEVMNVHYGDILIKYGEVLDISKDEMTYLADSSVVKKYQASLLKDGDVIIADAAEDGTVGKCSEIVGLSGKLVLSGLHTIPCRPISKFADGYLGYYMNSGSYHDQLLPLIQGTKISSISKSAIQDTDIVYPKSDEEQVLIGKYFGQLDNLISLHQCKYDKLTNLKKSMLEKMFPKNGSNVPEIRFKDFTEAWEQRKLGEVNTIFSDGNYGEAYPKSSDMTDSFNGVPFLTGGNLKNGKLDLTGANYISKSKHEQLISGHLVEDDIVIAVRGSLGSLGYVNRENSGWNINSQLAILRTDKNILRGQFLIQYLLSEKAQTDLMSRTTGSALKQLPIGQLKDFEVPVTKIEEQVAIGKYFQNLDHLITLHQRELEKLKNIKKACLERMIV